MRTRNCPNHSTRQSMWSRCALAAAAALAIATGARALEADPAKLTIVSQTEPVSIGITHNGAPVKAGDIGAVKLYIEKHDYDHMITVSKADGRLTLTPTPDLELGVYELAVNTTHGDLRVPITALQHIADQGLEARAKRQGVTVDEIKAQLGISQAVGQERITLGVSDGYYVGQTLKVDMKPAAGRSAEWVINGEKIAAADGALAYTFTEAGVYDLAYVEKQGDRVMAMGLGTTTVMSEPPVEVSAKAGSKQTLLGPDGYGSYAWRVDGSEAGTGSSWTGTFESAGEHLVTVRAEAPALDGAQPIRVVTYRVMVP